MISRANLMIVIALIGLGVFATTLAQALRLPSMTEELRYCGVVRDASGQIVRSATIVADFRRAHACPAMGLTSGACVGRSVDHVVPLVCGGCDAVSNMQWLPNSIKNCAGTTCKDRWEQRVYCPVRTIG